MQNISIKAGTSARFSISPKINDVVASAEQLAGVTIYVFFVYQFTDKIYGEPYKLTAGSGYNGKLNIDLSPEKTIEMLGNASENQNYEVQFAIKTADGNVLAEATNTNIVINITKWEAGQWLYQNTK